MKTQSRPPLSPRRSILLSSMLAAGLPASTWAQQASEESAGVLEEVIVSAQKREQSLQDVAVSVTALAGDMIRNSGILDPIQMQPDLPAVSFQVANTPVMVIRGVGTYNNQPGVDSAVAYVVDGTYLSHHPALPPILFDIDRVEVVRGPQGTLYGRNSNGGAMNLVSNRPELEEFSANLALSIGNYDALATDGMMNLPIGETAALRLAFATDDHDPYFDDETQGAENHAVRARLLVAPSDSFELIATVDSAEKEHVGQGSAYCPPNSAYDACSSVPWEPWAGYPTDWERAHFRIENDGLYLEMNWFTELGTWTSLTSYREYEIDNLWVWDFVDYEPDNDNEFFTQEVRLASPDDSPIEWVLGGFYSKETFSATEYYAFFGAPSLNFAWVDSESTSAAAFGQATYPLNDRLRLVGGLRYTHEEKDQSGNATTWDANGDPITVATGGEPQTESRFTWKLGVEYDAFEDSLLYANISTGFKSGGVNQVPPGLGLTEAYNPEEITAYQFGAKNRLQDGRLQINAEAFYYDYEGYQQYAQESDTSGAFPAVFFITVDSQEATFYGAEIEADWLATDNGVLGLYATFLHAEFDEFVVGSIDNTGNEVQGAPSFTFGGSWQQTIPLSNGGRIRGRIDTQYVDGHYVANNNAGGSYQDDYTQTGLSLSYDTPGDDWSFTAYVRNLEDEAILGSYADPISRGGDIGFLQAPRTYGLTLRWKYQ